MNSRSTDGKNKVKFRTFLLILKVYKNNRNFSSQLIFKKYVLITTRTARFNFENYVKCHSAKLNDSQTCWEALWKSIFIMIKSVSSLKGGFWVEPVVSWLIRGRFDKTSDCLVWFIFFGPLCGIMCPHMCDLFQIFPHSLSNIWTPRTLKIT